MLPRPSRRATSIQRSIICVLPNGQTAACRGLWISPTSGARRSTNGGSARPHARIVNLETSITHSDAFEPKGINYRMSPENAGCLTAAGRRLLRPGQQPCSRLGPGRPPRHFEHLGEIAHQDRRRRAAILRRPKPRPSSRSRTRAVCSCSRWRPKRAASRRHWAADAGRAGVNLLSSLSEATVGSIVDELAEIRRPRDVVVVSIHWGPNWGYPIPKDQRRFAHALIEEAGVSIVHGHSSHHAKAIEVYENRLILYGCGDFLNDYEGIAGYEEFRGDLSLMYFADVDAADGRLRALDMTPLKIRRLQLSRALARGRRLVAANA